MPEIKKNHIFEKDLQSLYEKIKASDGMTLREVFAKLAGRGLPILAILLSLPFCQPIQIPGMSTPFGLIIFFIGLRYAFGHHLWWPKKLLDKKISKRALEKIVKNTLWLLQKLNKISRVRLEWFFAPSIKILHGLMLAVLGLFLALPLPIPFSNILAAWAILLLCVGLIEDDGLFVLAGYLIGLFCLGTLGYIFFKLSHLLFS